MSHNYRQERSGAQCRANECWRVASVGRQVSSSGAVLTASVANIFMHRRQPSFVARESVKGFGR